MRYSLPTQFRTVTLLALLWGAISLSANPRIPIEAFFGTEAILQMQLSPDGDKIAMLAPNNGRYSLAVLDTKTGKAGVVVRLEDENIRSFFWKGNDRLLFYANIEGHEIPLLASIDIEGKSMKRILEPRLREDDSSIFFGALLDRFPSDDESILILGFTDRSDARAETRGSLKTAPSIYRVNVNTARRTRVLTLNEDYKGHFLDFTAQEPPLTDAGFFTAEGQQRLTMVVEGTKVKYGAREKNDQPLRILHTCEITGVDWEVLTLMPDGRTAYLIDRTVGSYGGLRSLDLDTERLSEPLFIPQQGEITRLVPAPRRKRLLGVAYEDTRARVHWMDPHWAKISATLEASFPGQMVSIGSISDDEKRFIFAVRSDRNPGVYYLGDLRGETMQVQVVASVRPTIKPEEMSPMEPIQYKARDGLTIHGYLTKPGGKADSKTPLLILPHGGPFGIRDSWGFNREVQFLASRGYAVLQVNYRGSGGYGGAFEHAGYSEWGGKMQDDLTDAVKWAIKEGYADPDRVGIMGASYGGYATLMGVGTTPELYRVGINYVGVSDLRQITQWGRERSAGSTAVFAKKISKDPKFLHDRSPINHVANFRVPTFHAYGRNDPRVKIENWTALEAALKKHNKPYEFMVEQKEGHGFEKAETSTPLYAAVEAFLAKHMPSDRNPAVKMDALKVIEMPAKPN
jgi:prolyl oligopeptidase PreP (S9A serine peptidase family)